MFRRCISLLVIVGLFASQLAEIPHAHAGMTDAQRQGHDAAPHGHIHHHGDHEHGAGNSAHRHTGEAPSPDGNGLEPTDASDNLGATDHDDSAIFIDSQSPANTVTPQKVQNASRSPFALHLTINVSLIAAWPAPLGTPRWQPPDATKDGSNIYLTLRNLRI